MTARSHVRGHAIEHTRDGWCYSDTQRPVRDCSDRPCSRCGELPTIEGYDSCLAHIAGATSACCGHGVEEGYIVDERAIEIMEALKRILATTCTLVPGKGH